MLVPFFYANKNNSKGFKQFDLNILDFLNIKIFVIDTVKKIWF